MAKIHFLMADITCISGSAKHSVKGHFDFPMGTCDFEASIRAKTPLPIFMIRNMLSSKTTKGDIVSDLELYLAAEIKISLQSRELHGDKFISSIPIPSPLLYPHPFPI
jgi:hypothetical protein